MFGLIFGMQFLSPTFAGYATIAAALPPGQPTGLLAIRILTTLGAS